MGLVHDIILPIYIPIDRNRTHDSSLFVLDTLLQPPTLIVLSIIKLR
jgi:hypothetical protein